MDLQITVRGQQELNKISTLVYNHFHGLKLNGICIKANDTDMYYTLLLERKLNKQKEIHLRAYIAGIQDCLKSL